MSNPIMFDKQRTDWSDTVPSKYLCENRADVWQVRTVGGFGKTVGTNYSIDLSLSLLLNL